MAFDLRPDAGDDEGGLHDINVTPLIDVMLVLLIIFMVAAPLVTVNVPLDLPVSSAKATPDPKPPVTVSLKQDLTIHLGDAQVDRAALAARLAEATANDRSARIFLRADKAVAYGDLMELMDALRAAGYLKVALVTLDSGKSR